MRAHADNMVFRTRFADRGLKAVSVSMWEKVEETAAFEVMYGIPGRVKGHPRPR